MNDQQALSIFAADPEAGLVNGGKYQNSCGFLAKLSSAGNLAFKTMKCVVNPDIDLGTRSGVTRRRQQAKNKNCNAKQCCPTAPKYFISRLHCRQTKRPSGKVPPITTEFGFRAVDLMAVLSPGAICTFPFLGRGARLWHSMGSIRRTLLIAIAKPRPPTSGVFHWPASAKRGITPAHLRAKNSSTAAS